MHVFTLLVAALPLVSTLSIPTKSPSTSPLFNPILHNEKRATTPSCGSVGYDTNTKAYFYLKSIPFANKLACGLHCLADTKCKSFAVGEGACLHYTTAVERNFKADRKSPNTFYDRSCATPSSTPSAASSITPTASIPVSTSSSCAVVGYDKNSPKAFYYTNAKSKSNQSACSALCQDDKQCRSFAYGSDGCYLYSVVVAGNFKPDKNSPYKFYDKSCPGSSSVKSSTVVTSTAKSSTPSPTPSKSSISSSPIPTPSSSAVTSSSSSTSSSAVTPSSSSTSSSTSISSATPSGTPTSSGTPVSSSVQVSSSTSSTPTPTPSSTAYVVRLYNVADNTPVGWISNSFNSFGEHGRTLDVTSALRITIPLPSGTTTGSGLEVLTVNSANYVDLDRLGFVTGFANSNTNLGPGTLNYAYSCATARVPPGPAQPADSSFTRASNNPRNAESALWSVDLTTLDIAPNWVNDDGSIPTIFSLLYQPDVDQGILIIVGDLGQFRNNFGTGDIVVSYKLEVV